jgi:hypothetical protein
MTTRNFYLKNNENKFLNVALNAGGNRSYITKDDYTLYCSDNPATVWYFFENTKNMYIIHVQNARAHYRAYGIEYKGSLSLSYDSKIWKLTDGLSTCCLTIENNMIIHPKNHNNILTAV